MKRVKTGWETPSLEWIHTVRIEEQQARQGHPPRPLPRCDAETLAARYGLKLAASPRSESIG